MQRELWVVEASIGEKWGRCPGYAHDTEDDAVEERDRLRDAMPEHLTIGWRVVRYLPDEIRSARGES